MGGNFVINFVEDFVEKIINDPTEIDTIIVTTVTYTLLLIWILFGLRFFLDFRRRFTPNFITTIAFLMICTASGPIGFLIYIILRPKYTKEEYDFFKLEHKFYHEQASKVIECMKCSHYVYSNNIHCTHCGTQNRFNCPNCSHLNSFKNRYCSSCGHPIYKFNQDNKAKILSRKKESNTTIDNKTKQPTPKDNLSHVDELQTRTDSITATKNIRISNQQNQLLTNLTTFLTKSATKIDNTIKSLLASSLPQNKNSNKQHMDFNDFETHPSIVGLSTKSTSNDTKDITSSSSSTRNNNEDSNYESSGPIVVTKSANITSKENESTGDEKVDIDTISKNTYEQSHNQDSYENETKHKDVDGNAHHVNYGEQNEKQHQETWQKTTTYADYKEQDDNDTNSRHLESNAQKDDKLTTNKELSSEKNNTVITSGDTVISKDK